MEVALSADLPTYSGGLGVLAGDTLRAAADVGLPMVGVTLLHRAGYFHQRLTGDGRQVEEPARWRPESWLTRTAGTASVSIEGREVHVVAWRFDVVGHGGHTVPVYLLDCDLAVNDPADRRLTDALYGGDHAHRLAQEIVLGIGGVRVLRSLGLDTLGTYHMNEGHAALLTAELMRELALRIGAPIDSEAAARLVRERCVFTTHTPLAAGHDRFSFDLTRQVAGEGAVFLRAPAFVHDHVLDTTRTALGLSRFANAVSRRHAEVTREMFPGHMIHAITNGVHPATWVHPTMREVWDRHAPGWQGDSAALAGLTRVPGWDVLAAHRRVKAAMVRRVNHEANAGLTPEAFTLGVARRCTPYKRLDMILADVPRLERLAAMHGPIQIVFAGKSHPRDGGGKEMLARLTAAARASSDLVRVAFVPNYDLSLAADLVAGVDVWVNVPVRPLEASGTSGMKAAMNGVPSLSVLDGWWVEGHEEGVTGWAIGDDEPPREEHEQWARDAEALYEKLERVIVPLYHARPEAWAEVMKGVVTRNGPRFSTHRMVREYAEQAYGVRPGAAEVS
ncbi:MAG: alpha-glucan phosphorylase [Phycisphaerae bacterium]|nr:MAG: alpha-glucan phosphorylase [Phycisphaerae bacterium]